MLSHSSNTPSLEAYTELLSNILTSLYAVQSPADPSYLTYVKSFFSSNNQNMSASESQLTMRQISAKKSALIGITKLISKPYSSYHDKLAEKILKAHTDLVEGCLNNNVDQVAEAISLINTMSIPPLAKKAFLEVRVTMNNNPDIMVLGLLGSASQNNYIDIVKKLLQSGANLSAEPILFMLLKKVLAPDFSRTVSYEAIRSHINLYLEAGFNIATLYENKNLLQYACSYRLSATFKAPIYFVAHKVSELFAQGKIEPEIFKEFCQQLQKSESLKMFPMLGRHYAKLSPEEKIYKTPAELEYYYLYALLFNLIDFCSDENERIKSDLLSFVVSNQKSDILNDVVKRLKHLQETYFSRGEYVEHLFNRNAVINLLSQAKDRLYGTFNIKRWTLFSDSPKPKSILGWEIFYRENREEIMALEEIKKVSQKLVVAAPTGTMIRSSAYSK